MRTLSNLTEDKAAKIVVGLLLAASPWVLAYSDQPVPTLNALGLGLLIAAIAGGAPIAFQHMENWATLALGLWTALGPWTFDFASSGATYAHIVFGLLAALLAALKQWSVPDRPWSTA